jgi:nitrous oxidase accessory protein NosD
VDNATLQHDLFQTGASGISICGKAAHWLISDNLIAADEAGISAAGARDIIISENHISGNIGVSLVGSTQVQVRKNSIQAEFQGVFLTQESWKNMIQGNTIFGVSQSGIALQPGVVGNRILANRVLCAANASCLTVDAAPEVAERNTIA